jgi:hypothetical protein
VSCRSKLSVSPNEGRERVYRIGASADERLELAAQRMLFEPGRPARYVGPLVTVEEPNGTRHRECGLDSAEHEIARATRRLKHEQTEC